MTPILINHNVMAQNVSNNLKSHYSRLSVSVQRLSSGLRIHSAADDAAGLAIRELMRADGAALNQGMRNANDAISMIQVADGALAIIDEKLIRMKELAEQAATGTYNSTQRLMIHSEFVAMGEEIDRIANATNFNGIKLLDGSLSGVHDGKGLNSTGKMKIHFGTANDSAEDYYYVDIGDCSLAGLGLRETRTFTDNLNIYTVQSHQDMANSQNAKQGGLGAAIDGWWNENEVSIDYTNRKIIFEIPSRLAGIYSSSPAAATDMGGMDFYQLPIGLKNVTITSNGMRNPSYPIHKAHVCLFTKDGIQLTGVPVPRNLSDKWTYISSGFGGTKSEYSNYWWDGSSGGGLVYHLKVAGVVNNDVTRIDTSQIVNRDGESVSVGNLSVSVIASQNEIGSASGNHVEALREEILFVNEVTENLSFLIGGHPNPRDGCNLYSLRIEAELTDEFLEAVQAPGHLPPSPPDPPDPPDLPDPPGPDTPAQDVSLGDIISIKTQDEAQQALERIDDAIIAKDKVRAHLGALQNRLENTVTNLTIMAENLLAAESRISDVDVATEMSVFVRNQILTQSAVAMLGQANSYPHMLSGLING